MKITKIAPTLIVDKIAPSLNFFVEALGFTKAMEVPGESGLAFALLVKDSLEIHLQARSSAGTEIPYLGKSAMPPSCFLYLDVDDVQGVYEKLKDTDLLFPLAKTPWGAQHFFIREPGGHVIGFSQNAD